MSTVDEALENLKDHGVDVESPETVKSHDQVNSKSELFSTFGVSEGLEAASYSSLDDRIDIYKPLAATRVINELDDEDMEQVTEAFERNRDAFSDELRTVGLMGDDLSFADSVKLSKFHYLAAVNDSELDDNFQQDLRDSLDEELLHDSEHELVHASHYQDVMDGNVEPLEQNFRNYVRDVKNINEDLDRYAERQINEGISTLKDIELAAAMDFVDDDRLQNIVSLAGREHMKWENKYKGAHEQYRSEKEEVTSDVTDSLDPMTEFKFDELTNLADPKMDEMEDFEGIDQAVDELEEEGVDEYEEIRQAGVSKQEIKDTLKDVREVEEEWKEKTLKPLGYKGDTVEHLEGAILREAELQGDFEGHMEQYADRVEKSAQVPTEFTEAFAQFWTAYRKGNLEDNREEVYDRLDGYDAEGLDETMDDIFQMYDKAQGSQEERVTQVISSQMDYLEQNYDLESE